MPPTPTSTNDTGSGMIRSSASILAQFPVLVQHGEGVGVSAAHGDAVARAEDEAAARLGAFHGPADVGADVLRRPADEVLDGDAAPERDPVAVILLQAADVHSRRRLDGLVGGAAELDEENEHNVYVAAPVLA